MREAFEKWLGESPTYTECGARYVNHVVNEQWKAWKHQQARIDELVRSMESDRVQRFEEAWAGRVVPMLTGVKVQKDPYLPAKYMIVSPDLFEAIRREDI